MPVNAHPDYLAAEKEYLLAETLEQKLKALEKMISSAPKHKGAENLRAELNQRYKKLKSKFEKRKKSKKGPEGIKKAEMQAVIIGMANSGKSSLLRLLTNAEPEIADYSFTTKKPVVGMMDFENIKIQLIEIPAFESEYYNKGLVNTADTILILVKNLEQIKQIEKGLVNTRGKKIIIYNLSSKEDKRKISETLKSGRYNFVILDLKSDNKKNKINKLKQKIFQSFNKIRVYTKEPGKEKTKKPIILNQGASVKDAAEKILHGFSKKIKESFVTGPSSKFPYQKTGLKHELKDLDVVEFRTK